MHVGKVYVELGSLNLDFLFNKEGEVFFFFPKTAVWLVGFTCLYFIFVSEESGPVRLYAYKTPHHPFLPFLFSPRPVSHFHAPFQGKGREKANKQDLFPEFMFSKRAKCMRGGGSGHGCVGGGLWPEIENCYSYPERSVYTTCKVKQIDPGCRFARVFL